MSFSKLLRYTLVAAAAILLAGGSSVMAAPTAPSSVAASQQPPILGINDKQNYLHLTATQQKRMIAILTEASNEHGTLLADKTMTPQQKQTKWLAFVKATQSQMKAILTPAQLQISEAHAKEAAKYRAGIEDLNKKAQALGQQLKDSMSASQNKTMQDAAATAQKQMTVIRGNKSLTPQQQEDQLEALSAQLNKTISSILTPKQQAMVDQLKTYQEEAVNLEKLAMSQ